MDIVRVYVLIYWLIIYGIPLFCFGKNICRIPNHITQVLLLCTPAVVFLIKLYTEFLTVNLYYKERRQLKTFSPKSELPYPSRRTHSPYVFGSG
jgi:hypothetical protein